MTAGLFRNAGLQMGDNLHAPTDENPKGYFESAAINRLNNQILSRYVPSPVSYDGLSYQCDAPGARNGWLSRIPVDIEIEATGPEQEAIGRFTAQQPFCLKDTRFCYVLHLWRESVANAAMICVFRAPEITAESILKSCRTRPGLFDVAISVNQAFEIWTLMYRHVLERHARTGSWLFLNYQDFITGAALDAVEAFSGIAIDRDFVDPSLRRTQSGLEAPPAAKRVYAELILRASATP